MPLSNDRRRAARSKSSPSATSKQSTCIVTSNAVRFNECDRDLRLRTVDRVPRLDQGLTAGHVHSAIELNGDTSYAGTPPRRQASAGKLRPRPADRRPAGPDLWCPHRRPLSATQLPSMRLRFPPPRRGLILLRSGALTVPSASLQECKPHRCISTSACRRWRLTFLWSQLRADELQRESRTSIPSNPFGLQPASATEECVSSAGSVMWVRSVSIILSPRLIIRRDLELSTQRGSVRVSMRNRRCGGRLASGSHVRHGCW